MIDEILIDKKTPNITKLWFNRIDKKHAITSSMYSELTSALEEANADENVHLLVLQGVGNVFTAGNDLHDFISDNTALDENAPVIQFLLQLKSFNKPLLAAVDGAAIGIGSTALLHCDYVLAADSAMFCFPFVNLGLVPEAASSYLLPKLAGHLKASELLMFGDAFNAKKALEIGMINEIVNADELTKKIDIAAQTLAKKSPTALQLTKRLMREADKKNIHQAMTEENKLFAQRLDSSEVQAIVANFLKQK